MRTYLSAIASVCMILLFTGHTVASNISICNSEMRAPITLDFEAMLQDPDIAELLFIKEEMLSIITSADKTKLLDSLKTGDLGRFARDAGLSRADEYSYQERLHSITPILLDRYPELIDFMPLRPFVESPEAAALVLKRLPFSEELNGALVLPFSEILQTVESYSAKAERWVTTGSLSWSGGLNPPPPTGPFDPCALGVWDPNCDPGLPATPPSDQPDLPETGGAPWEPEGDCQAGPYFAGMIMCATLPTLLVPICMYTVMCSSCQGGVFDSLCFGG